MFIIELRLSKLEQQWYLISDELKMVEKCLTETVRISGPDVETVSNHIISGSAKRIRPALFFLAAYQPGKSLLPLIDIAVAFELMHTASLMHDDVIDQAATRRGKDAVHIKWGNKIAILTGDYLLSQVFRIFVASKSWELMEIAVEIVENITTGEVEQAFAGQDSGELEAQYFRWIGKKSASFFAGCCKAGSLMSGGNKEQQKIWFDYGYNLGIAFQLIDDLLDYTGEGSLTGKPLYGDLVNRVLTLPLIRTLEQTSGNGQLNSYLKGNNNSSYNLEDLEAIADIILAGDGPEYTYRKAEEYAKRSIDLVASLEIDGSEHKTMVEEVPRSLLRRNK